MYFWGKYLAILIFGHFFCPFLKIPKYFAQKKLKKREKKNKLGKGLKEPTLQKYILKQLKEPTLQKYILKQLKELGSQNIY
jgi:hypothetical protein